MLLEVSLSGFQYMDHYMVVSKNRGNYPQIIHFNRVFPYKPSIFGYPYFWKHPYVDISSSCQLRPTPMPRSETVAVLDASLTRPKARATRLGALSSRVRIQEIGRDFMVGRSIFSKKVM